MDFIDQTLVRLADTSTRDALFDEAALASMLNQSQGETRRVNAVGLTEAEHAVRPCDGRVAHNLEAG